MAVIGSKFVDLVDLYKGQDTKGNTVDVIEMLMEELPILDDAIAVECNSGTTHLHTVRSGLPDVAWGRLYQGIPNSKSTKTQVTDTTGFVEGKSEVDVRLLELSKNEGAVRLSEAESYIESMSQNVAARMFYGNSASDPEEFMGLAPRFNNKSAANGGQIVDAGGTGSDNSSIWFVTWGENQCNLLYPEGTQAGLTRQDKGEQKATDGNGDSYYVKEEVFRWHVGLSVRDWRYVSRIANVDMSLLAAGSVDLYQFMRNAYYKLQSRRKAAGRMAIYCNTDILEALDGLATNAGTTDNFTRLKVREIQGEEVMTYRGIPIRESDSLINTEARVV